MNFETILPKAQSPYAPIRLRDTFWWKFGQRIADEKRIFAEGYRHAGLEDYIGEKLILPMMQYVQRARFKDQNDQEFTGAVVDQGRALALVLAQEMNYWVPMAALYELNGRQIFDLGDELSEMLAHTDFGDTTLDKWQAPYTAFYVRFGLHEHIKLRNEAGELEYVDGAFIAKVPRSVDPDTEYTIQIALTTVSTDARADAIPGYFFDISPAEQQMPVREGLDQALARNINDLVVARDHAEHPEMEGLFTQYIALMEDCRIYMQSAAELIVNALFYLESVGSRRPPTSGRDTPPELEAQWMQATPEKKRKLRSRLTREGYAVVYLMGQELVGGRRPGGSGSKSAHWRRGHWRWQPHGAGREQVKRIWIKPVMIHSDLSPTDPPGHLYVTGAPPTPH